MSRNLNLFIPFLWEPTVQWNLTRKAIHKTWHYFIVVLCAKYLQYTLAAMPVFIPFNRCNHDVVFEFSTIPHGPCLGPLCVRVPPFPGCTAMVGLVYLVPQQCPPSRARTCEIVPNAIWQPIQHQGFYVQGDLVAV